MTPGVWENELNLKKSVLIAMLRGNLVARDVGTVQVTPAVRRARVKEVVVQVREERVEDLKEQENPKEANLCQKLWIQSPRIFLLCVRPRILHWTISVTLFAPQTMRCSKNLVGHENKPKHSCNGGNPCKKQLETVANGSSKPSSRRCVAWVCDQTGSDRLVK